MGKTVGLWRGAFVVRKQFVKILLGWFFVTLSPLWAEDISELSLPLSVAPRDEQEGIFTGEDHTLEQSSVYSAQDNFVPSLLVDRDTRVRTTRSPWSMSYFNWATINARQQNRNQGRLSTYNHLSFEYRLTYNSKFAVRPTFFINGAGQGDPTATRREGFYEESSFEIGDIYLQYNHNRLGLIPTNLGDVGVVGAFRWYVPNSNYSKSTRQIGNFWARFLFERPLPDGWQVNYALRPRVWVHTQKTYYNELARRAIANEYFRVEHFFEVLKALGDTWGVKQEIGAKHRWYYGSKVETRQVNNQQESLDERVDSFLRLGSSVFFYVHGVSLTAGVSYEPKLGSPGRSTQVYDESDTVYQVLTYVAF